MSLRHPTDKTHHAVHNEINADILYLPEYIHRSPLRVIRALFTSMKTPGFGKALRRFKADFSRDRTRNRIRRFAQGAVLAAEWPSGGQWLHAHFLHTPASVTAYASVICDIPWTVSAHAKDIWTSPDWELSEKLDDARWAVTCTGVGHKHLQSLAADGSKVHLSYHGLDLTRFPAFNRGQSTRDGLSAEDPVVIVSVGRAVQKKGFDILLRSLASMPATLHWRFVHIGGGTELIALQTLAKELGIAERISWLGAIEQSQVLENYQKADIFALACRVTADGDRDGLPNVLLEAASQGLACISTTISGIPEFFDDSNGLLVEPENPTALSTALRLAIESPQLRDKLGSTAQHKLRSEFDHNTSIRQLVSLFESQWARPN